MNTLRSFLLALCAALTLTTNLSAQPLEVPRLDALWVDNRIPAEERTLLERAIGFAPPATDTLRVLTENKPSWADLRGKVVVIQTWNSGSEAGRAAPQRAIDALKSFTPDQVHLIALHTPQGVDDASAFIKARPIDATVVADGVGTFCDDLGIWRRPVTILIDRRGTVRASGLAFVRLEQAVKYLLTETYDPKAEPARAVPTRAYGASPAAASKGDGKYPQAPAFSQGADLRGKKGPPIVAASWINGQPDTSNKVVILDFWATWCGPCVAMIPHMNGVQKKFKDSVVVIGISDETDPTVRQFYKNRKMEYAVAADPQKRMHNVVKPRSIPQCLIMSPDGVVRWQGHPQQMTDDLINRIVAASGAGPSAPAGQGLADSDTIRWVTK